MSSRQSEAIRMADEGEIENAASVIALNWLARHHAACRGRLLDPVLTAG